MCPFFPRDSFWSRRTEGNVAGERILRAKVAQGFLLRTLAAKELLSKSCARLAMSLAFCQKLLGGL